MKVHYEGTMDGSGNCHKHRYDKEGIMDGSGDCYKQRYIQKKLCPELVIAQA